VAKTTVVFTIQQMTVMAMWAARRRVFSWSVDNFIGGGKRISSMTLPTYTGRHSFTGISPRDLVEASDGALSMGRARRALIKLATIGSITRVKAYCGAPPRYFAPQVMVDLWFDEARKFYEDAGLSLNEIRHVTLPSPP
jgi:hypothetical protein